MTATASQCDEERVGLVLGHSDADEIGQRVREFADRLPQGHGHRQDIGMDIDLDIGTGARAAQDARLRFFKSSFAGGADSNSALSGGKLDGKKSARTISLVR